MNFSKHLSAILLIAVPFVSFSQRKASMPMDRIEPPHWWIGMKNTELQILFYKHDEAISDLDASISYPGIKIKEEIKVENPHYLFLKLQVDNTVKAGLVPIQFKSDR